MDIPGHMWAFPARGNAQKNKMKIKEKKQCICRHMWAFPAQRNTQKK